MYFYVFSILVIHIVSPLSCTCPEYVTNGCQNGGTCLFNDLNVTISCECLSNFTGLFCENSNATPNETSVNGTKGLVKMNTELTVTDTDSTLDAQSNPPVYSFCPPNIAALCENGGTCLLVNNQFHCSCAYGFAGYNCEIPYADFENITDISASSINTSETLAPSTNSYSLCSSDYNGVCLNGGTCYFINDNLECACQFGYAGFFCELSFMQSDEDYSNTTTTDSDLISSTKPAMTTTTTTPFATTTTAAATASTITLTTTENDGYYYICPPKYDGLCQNGATCLYQGTNIVCVCKHGYSGIFCEHKT